MVPMVEAPILIVDDNELHIRTWKSILEGKGHSVMAFETGAAAIEMAKGCRFSLALLDVKLPDIRGDERARRLKELDGGLNIILITGYPSMQDCIDALELGVHEILVKPIDSQELLRATREALMGRRP